MTPNPELKAQLMVVAEGIIDEVLTETARQATLPLSDIERVARRAGEALMTDLTAELVEQEAARGGNEQCPDCGARLRYKGKKARQLLTESGEVRLERAYYYCPVCRQGHFPPGPAVGGE